MAKEFKIEARKPGHQEWDEVDRMELNEDPRAVAALYQMYEGHNHPGCEFRALPLDN